MAEITYTRHDDYYLPNIILCEPPDAEPLTKYGMMRKNFLKEHHPILYSSMLLREELYPHCREVQRTAESRLKTMMEQLIQSDPPPDNAMDSLAWAAHMNMLKHIAEETILTEMIFE